MEAGPPGGPPWPGEARVSFEWLEGRAFLIERWTVDLPEAPDGIAIIGEGDEPERFRQYYFDSRGVHRIYEMSLDAGRLEAVAGCAGSVPAALHRYPQRRRQDHYRTLGEGRGRVKSLQSL
jgi:hypothetical protein